MASLFWSGWRNFFRSGLTSSDKGTQYAEPLSVRNVANADVSDTRAMQISAVFSCIRLISECVGSLPIHVYRRLPNGEREAAPDHWLARLLVEPNPYMTGQELRECMATQLAGWGNSYTLTLRANSGRPTELFPLRPSSIDVQRDGLKGVKYKYCSEALGDITYGLDDVLHVRGFGAEGFKGLSPLGFARETLGLAVSSEEYAARFFANGGKPSGVAELEQILKPEQRKALREMLEGQVGTNARSSQSMLILEAGMKYKPISIPPEDAQMLETRSFQIAEIARVFRVPLFLLMDETKNTSWGAGLEQQNLAFLTYTIQPYLTRIERTMNRWLLSETDRREYFVEFNVEGLLRSDSKARAEFYSTMVQNGLMSRNEVRQKENLPRMPGADQLTAQVNLAPLDRLGAQPEPPAMPAPGVEDDTE